MKWIKFSEQKPVDGQICLCKTVQEGEDGDWREEWVSAAIYHVRENSFFCWEIYSAKHEQAEWWGKESFDYWISLDEINRGVTLDEISKTVYSSMDLARKQATKWIKITDQRPRDGMYCLCKKRHGDGDFSMFFATYREYLAGDYVFSKFDGDYDARDSDRERCGESVDYWMDAYALDNEASNEVE